MKILLVDPPGRNKGLNTGLGYLSMSLKDKHEVKVLDLNNIEMGICGDPNPELPADEMEKRIVKTLNEFNPRVLGVSVKTFTVDLSKRILNLVKKTGQNDIVTVVGGPHITLDGFNFIQDSKVDYGIQGEGEYTMLELCNALEQRKNIENIEGLFYWKDDQAHHNLRNDLMDINTVAFPSYDRFTSVMDNGGVVKEYPILTSRGCPYKCSYCSMPKIMGGKWRYRAPEGVIEELQSAKQKYKSTSFTVVDDNFTLNLHRVEKICDLLMSENINLPWNNQNGIRADRISEDMAKKMKSAGCRYVWIGIESADKEVFDAIKKGEKLEDVKAGIKHLQKAGIRVGGFFIIGLPYSTRSSDLKSIAFAQEQGIDGFWFNFVPYPHTRASEWVQAHGKTLRSSEGALQFGSTSIEPVFETVEYPREDRIRAYNDIHIQMKYFDRLVDPSLKQYEKWPKVFQLVTSYGFGETIAFMMFILRYNANLIVRKLKGQKIFAT